MCDLQPDRSTLQTRWSMLDRLHGSDAAPAWSWFVERYRPAIHRTLTCWLGQARAAEVADGFWGYLFDRGVLLRADRTRRFRQFLWGIARMYALKHLDPGREVPLSTIDIEDRAESAGSVEMRLWAGRVLRLALEELRRKYPDDADALERFYGLGDEPPMPAPELARSMGRRIGTLHVLLHRARQRLRVRVVTELRETVRDPAELEDEIALVLGTMQHDHPGIMNPATERE